MANQLKVQEQQAIKNLAALGWGIRRIARELRVSRNTVRNYVRMLEQEDPEVLTERIIVSSLTNSGSGGAAAQTDPLSTPGSEGLLPQTDPVWIPGSEALPSQTDPLSTLGSKGPLPQTDPVSIPGSNGRKSLCLEHELWIQRKVEAGLSAQRIYQDLKAEHGFAGSYQSVKRYVHKVRQTDPKLVYRIEVAPGEEVQVDFGTGPTLIRPEGKRSKTWIFRIVLSHSRKAYSEGVRRQDTETFIRCLENAFRHFGGVALTVNLDNLKAAVLKFDWADPELNPKLLDFGRHYRTTILPCLPQTPEHKGKIEAGVKYVKRNALAGRKFESLAALNQFLARWEQTVADLRIHGTTRRQVAELFAAEKPFLQPLPASVFPFFHEGPRSVHRDGHVEVEKAYYHVPPEYLGHRVWVRYNGREVRIFIQDQQGVLNQIQVHRRLEPGQFTNARGIGGGQGTLHANLRYWVERASNLGSGCSLWAQAAAQNRGIEAIRTLMGLVRLVDRYSFPAINRACAQAHARGNWRLRDVRNLLDTKELQPQLPFDEHHPLIRKLSEYQLFVQTKTQSL